MIDLNRAGNVYSIAEAKKVVVVRVDGLAAVRVVRDAERLMLANV